MAIYFRSFVYRILIIGGSRLGKTNALLNLINKQNDIDKNLFVRKRFKQIKV